MQQNAHDSNKHSLPSQPTPFIGRETELAEIDKLLADSTCRLLTLCGSGGIGKTRLAIEAATRNIDKFTDGIGIVNLEPLTSENDIVPAIATALDLQLQDTHDHLQQLLNYLSGKRILLIMDNFEHLIDGVHLVTELLDATPELNILATSREALKLREEWIRYIRGLDVPDNAHVSDLENYSAVQLFVESVRRVRGDFSLATSQSCVVRLCQVVEGMPLALELAASWLKVMPCAEIITEMQRSLDLLESPLVNMPTRHRSITAVFDQSWRLLSEEEQVVFKKLAIFRGGFYREAAMFVTESSLATLFNLVDKALLRVDDDGRYHLHSLLRQYAEEKLTASPNDYITTRDRHCQYYTEYLYERGSDLWSSNSSGTRDDVAVRLDNIRQALDWALEQEYITELWKALCAFTPFCYRKNLWKEGYIIYGRFAMLARRLTDREHLWRALASQGWFAHCLSDFEEAAQLYEEALIIGRQSHWHGNVQNKDFLMLRLSEMAMRQGNLEKATEYIEEIADDQFYNSWPLWIRETQGRIAYLAGNYPTAKKLLKEALAFAQTYQNESGIVVTSNHLGYLYLAQGHYQAARRTFADSLAYGQKSDYRRGVVRTLVGLGFSAFYLEESNVAWFYFSQALEKGRNIGNNLEILNTIMGIAMLLAKEGHEAYALELLAYARHHPAVDWEAREKAEQFLNMLKRELPSEMTTQAEEKAKTLDLDTIVNSILSEYPVALGDEVYLTPPSPEQGLIANQALPEPLTKRELEVLKLIADGHSNSQIADQLFIGVSTVKKHVTHIFGKLGVSSRTQAISRLRELQL